MDAIVEWLLDSIAGEVVSHIELLTLPQKGSRKPVRRSFSRAQGMLQVHETRG
jgi:hypothetical protein